jgi:hypothetical protein
MVIIFINNSLAFYYKEWQFTGRRDMVYIKFILLKSDGNLSNFHSVCQILMKFPIFVEMLWKCDANWTNFRLHQGFHSGTIPLRPVVTFLKTACKKTAQIVKQWESLKEIACPPQL